MLASEAMDLISETQIHHRLMEVVGDVGRHAVKIGNLRGQKRTTGRIKTFAVS